MSDFEFSTLGLLCLLLVAIGAYSFWQIHRAKTALQRRLNVDAEYVEVTEVFVPDVIDAPLVESEPELSEGEPNVTPIEMPAINPATAPVRKVRKNAWVQRSMPDWPDAKAEMSPTSTSDSNSDSQQNTSENNASNSSANFSEDSLEKASQATSKNTSANAFDQASSSTASLVNDPRSVPSFLLQDELPLDSALAPAKVIPQTSNRMADIEPTLFKQDELQGMQTPAPHVPPAVPRAPAQVALDIYAPIADLLACLKSNALQPIDGIDGVIELVLSQPKNKTDIERSLHDLRLDTDLPLRIYGRRSGAVSPTWQPLEPGALYSGLCITLQLANPRYCAEKALIQSWFALCKRLAKRISATVPQWPELTELLAQAAALSQLARLLDAPILVQLVPAQGHWLGRQVDAPLKDLGANLNGKGQFVARADDGKAMYSVYHDLSNPQGAEFHERDLPDMAVQALSFCVDLARVPAVYQPCARLWHDMHKMAHHLNAVWANKQGEALDVSALMTQYRAQIDLYYRHLAQLHLPAGSPVLKRLLRVKW
jgi:hypothetical protein